MYRNKFEVNQVLNLDASIEYHAYKIQGVRQIALDNKPSNVRVFISQNSMKQNARELRNRDDGYAELPYLVDELFLFTEGTNNGFIKINYTGNKGNYYKYGNDTIAQIDQVEKISNIENIEGGKLVTSIFELLEKKQKIQEQSDFVFLKFKIEIEPEKIGDKEGVWKQCLDFECTLPEFSNHKKNSQLQKYKLDGIEFLQELFIKNSQLCIEILGCDNFKFSGLRNPEYLVDMNFRKNSVIADHVIQGDLRGGTFLELIDKSNFKVINSEAFYSIYSIKTIEYFQDMNFYDQENPEFNREFNAHIQSLHFGWIYAILSFKTVEESQQDLKFIKDLLIKKYFTNIMGDISNNRTHIHMGLFESNSLLNDIFFETFTLDCFVKVKAIR